MFRLAAAAALAACSTPSTKADETASAPVSGAATTTTTSPAPVAAPLDVSGLAFVPVPALTPPAGARLQIGLELVDEVGALSPAGDVLALAGATRGVQLIHLSQARGLAHRADLTCQEPTPGFVGPCIPKLAFAADGRRVAAWWPELGRLVVLGVPDGTTRFEAAVTEVSTLSFLDDGRLAVAHGDRVSAFDAAGQRHELVHTADLDAGGRVPFVARISGDGGLLVIASHEATRLVDVATRRVRALPASLELDDVVLGRDGQSLVGRTSGEWPDVVTWREGDRTARTLASSSAARARPYSLGVRGFAFPPPGDRVFITTTSPDELVAVGLDGTRSFRTSWYGGASLEPGDVVARDGTVVVNPECPLRLDARGAPIPGPILCAHLPLALGFGPDRLYARNHGNVLALDLTTGHLVTSRVGALPAPGATLATLERDPELARRVDQAIARAGLTRDQVVTVELVGGNRTLLVRGDQEKGSTIVNLSTGRLHGGLGRTVASRDGARVAIATPDDRVEVRRLDGAGGAPRGLVRALEIPHAWVSNLALSDDGKWLVAPYNDTLVFEVASGQSRSFPCRAPAVLSPDARRLACSGTGVVELHDLAGRQPTRTFRLRPHSTIDALAFSDDGRRLAIGAGNVVVVDL